MNRDKIPQQANSLKNYQRKNLEQKKMTKIELRCGSQVVSPGISGPRGM